MERKNISFGGVTVCIECADHYTDSILPLLAGFSRSDERESSLRVRLIDDHDSDQVVLYSSTRDISVRLDQRDLTQGFLSFITDEIASAIDDRLVLHAAAVQVDDCTLIIPGRTGTEKSILTACFVGRGYRYLTDELVCIRKNNFEYLSRPLNIRNADLETITDLLGDKTSKYTHGKDFSFVHVRPDLVDTHRKRKATLFMFPRFLPGSSLSLEFLTPAQSALGLMSCLVNSRNLGTSGLSGVSAQARNIPALRLTYGATVQLEEIRDKLFPLIAGFGLSPHEIIALFSPFKFKGQQVDRLTPAPPPDTCTKKIPTPTPAGPRKRLTIGMATYDDFDGVYFSVQAIRMYHPEITEQTEIIVVDNNPEGKCADDLKKLDASVKGYRYLPFKDHSGTAVRDYIFRQANSEYVLVIDCHVLVAPGALKQLIDFLDKNKECRDLFQGPMLHDNNSRLSTHFNVEWNDGMYGSWGTDDRIHEGGAEPFEIPMQGLGLFACRKDAWVGFNPRFRGFGGEEGYIHEKFRQAGGKVYCLPFLHWMHRFQRPSGVPYSINWKDRIHNYMVGFRELGLDTTPIRKHFGGLLDGEGAETIFKEIDAELSSPFSYFDAIYCITMDHSSERWKKIQQRFIELGIDQRVRVFEAIATPENHHVGCALSHRSIIALAQQSDLANVLVFEDDAIFLDETIHCLDRSVTELKDQDWHLFYLGGCAWGKTYPLADHCNHLSRSFQLSCTHAIAYNRNVYTQILEDIPVTVEEVTDWVKEHVAIDQYLMNFEQQYLSEPKVSSQIQLLPEEQEEYRARFTLGEGKKNKGDNH